MSNLKVVISMKGLNFKVDRRCGMNEVIKRFP